MDQSEIEQIHAAGAKRGKTNTSYSHVGFVLLRFVIVITNQN